MKIKLYNNENSINAGTILEPACSHPNGDIYLHIGSGAGSHCTEHNTNWVVSREHYGMIDNNKTMNIKEKFVLALTKEQKKSFRKAGITNGDDLLTDEGQNIFLSWLLHGKFSMAFKTEVVDELLIDNKDK